MSLCQYGTDRFLGLRVDTDEGVTGYGEVCPLGPFYLPAYAAGCRAGLKELAPHLIGVDPLQLDKLNRWMDTALKGHPYVKSGIDMACWDILGQVSGQPVCTLLGGRYGDDFVLYRAISQEAPEAMAGRVAGYRDEGYRRFQLKVGGDPNVDIARIHAVAANCSRATNWWPTPTPAGSCMRLCASCGPCVMWMFTSNSPVSPTKSAWPSVGLPIIRLSSMKSSTGSTYCTEAAPTWLWMWSTSRSANSVA